MRQLTLGSMCDGLGGWCLAAIRNGIKPIWSSEIDKNCLLIEKRHFPDVKQLGDLMGLTDLPPVDIICAGTPCFLSGTMVTTKRGFIPIEEVRTGDTALTHNGLWETVTCTMKHGARNYYKLVLEGNEPTYVTGNHPYYVRHCKRVGHYSVRSFDSPQWKNVEDLEDGDFIGYPIAEISGDNDLKITTEEAYLIGRYIADGYINNSKRSHRENSYNHKVIFCIGKAKAEEFESHLHEYKACKKEERTVFKYEVISERLMGLCEMCGRGAINKEIPTNLFKDRLILEGIIDGYMSGDGFYDERQRLFKATTISRKLAYSLQMAVHAVYGTPCSVKIFKRPPTCVIEGRAVNQHDTYTATFKKELPKQTHCYVDGGFIWRRVRKKEKIDEPCTVYNLEVGDSHSYMANGVAVHNCQSFSLAGKRKGMAGQSGLFLTAIRLVYRMLEQTNGEFPKLLVWENVPGVYSSKSDSEYGEGDSDFRRVIQEITKADIPMPKSGRWAESGLVRSPKCDVAWRCLDAQYWGVPQRRNRVFLIADFRQGGRCPEVLFIEPSLPRDSEPSGEAGQTSTGSSESGTDETSYAVRMRYGRIGEGGSDHSSKRIGAEPSQPQMTKQSSVSGMTNETGGVQINQCQTLAATDYKRPPVITDPNNRKIGALCAGDDRECGNQYYNQGKYAIETCYDPCHRSDVIREYDDGKSPTITQMCGSGGGNVPFVLEGGTWCVQGNVARRGEKSRENGNGINKELSFTLDTVDVHAVVANVDDSD